MCLDIWQIVACSMKTNRTFQSITRLSHRNQLIIKHYDKRIDIICLTSIRSSLQQDIVILKKIPYTQICKEGCLEFELKIFITHHI